VAALAAVAIAAFVADPTVFGLLDASGRGRTDAARPPEADGEAALREQAREEAGRLVGFPGVRLSKRGTGVVSGVVGLHVAGAGEKPLAGAEVELLSLVDGRETRVEAVSDAEGAFTLAPVPALAGWVLRARHAPHRDLFVRGISVHENRTTDVGHVVFGAPTSLSGTVVDSAGRPIPGATVAVLRSGSAGGGFDLTRALRDLASGAGPMMEGRTEGDGRFTLKGLAPGRYDLRVGTAGHASAFVHGVYVTADGDSGEVRVVLDPGAGFFGRVLDADGRGVAMARVLAVPIRPERGEGVDRQETLSDAAGKYRLDTLVSGSTYFVEAHRDGFAPTGKVTSTDGVTALDFTLVAGGRIAGHVTDAKTGKAVAGAEVLVVTGLTGSGVGPVATVAGEDGGYALENVVPGPVVLLEVRAPGYGPGGHGFDPRQMKEVKPGETLVEDVALDRGGRLFGAVTAKGGGPIAYASVVAAPERNRFGGEFASLTDARGEYSLLGLRPGKYVLAVTAGGYASPTSDADSKVEVAEGQEIRRDFALEAGATVEGTVRAPDGEVAAGARLVVEAADARALAGRVRDLVVVADAQGAFRVVGLPTGVDLVLVAAHDAWVRTRSAPFRVGPGEAKRLDVALRRGSRVVGRVVDSLGRPVAEARVRFGHVDPADEGRLRDSFRADELLSPRTYSSDAGGGFVVDRAEPGKALLKVEATGFAAWYRKDLLVPEEGDVTDVVATLEGAAKITGRVSAAEGGAHLAGAWVYAQWKGAVGDAKDDGRVRTVVSAETAADGSYALERCPPGTYDVVVWFAAGYVTGDDPACRRAGVAAGTTGVDFRLARTPTTPPGGG
jgi:protocatechuate 3,4-dioxygenase beta subunit